MNAGSIVKRRWAMVLAGAVLMTMIVCATPASAQGQVHERAPISIKIAQAESVVFNIPSQSLRTALSTFAEQSGWQLFYSAEVAEGSCSEG